MISLMKSKFSFVFRIRRKMNDFLLRNLFKDVFDLEIFCISNHNCKKFESVITKNSSK